jgi:hypothetical protein
MGRTWGDRFPLIGRSFFDAHWKIAVIRCGAGLLEGAAQLTDCNVMYVRHEKPCGAGVFSEKAFSDSCIENSLVFCVAVDTSI